MFYLPKKYFFWQKKNKRNQIKDFIAKNVFGRNLFLPTNVFSQIYFCLPQILFAKYIFFGVLTILIPLISCHGGGLCSLSVSSLVIDLLYLVSF